MYFNTCISFLFILNTIRQVFLARRRDKDKQFYAIKVVKKTDVVNKNMIEQGLYVYFFFFFFFLNWILNCKLTLFLISHNALCLPPTPPKFYA